MKKLAFLLIIAFTALNTQARDINPENVPANVKAYVKKNYPQASSVKWEDKTKKGYYEAEFRIDGREVELDISTKGTLLKSKEDILIKDIPSFATSYIDKNYKGSEILGANKKIENGATRYSVGIRFQNNDGYERHRNIVFDSKGNVIKK